MSKTETVVAIDIGGSGSRAVVRGPDGVGPILHGPAVRVSHAGIDLGEVLDAFADRLPQPERIDTVSVGMSGVIGLTTGERPLAELRGRWPHATILLASDAATAAASALGDAGGTIIALGTGVVGLATDFANTWKRVDGWGHLFGDEGGGAWVGMCALRRALRSFDGRAGGSSALLAAAVDFYGPPMSIPAQFYTRDDRARHLAAFVPFVERVAAAGDPGALAIGHEAAEAVVDAARALLAEPVPRRLVLVGGLLRARTLIRTPLCAALARTFPDVDLSLPPRQPLDGALAFADMTTLPTEGYPPFVMIDRPFD